MTVIAVGHTCWKMDRLVAMIPQDIEVVKVFNGTPHRRDAINVKNDPDGRDVAMYAKGLKQGNPKRAIFVNDDVIHLSASFWELARRFLAFEVNFDIAGVANLSSWIPYEKCNENQLRWHKHRGRKQLFIRTSAFMAKRNYFKKVYADACGKAQPFEKLTILSSGTHQIIEPEHAYDSNIEAYVIKS